MDQIIKRAALRTLAAIGILIVVTVLALVLLFPSTMMNITYDLGMENASVNYAMQAYKRNGQIEYVARATETAILADNDEKIGECAGEFIAHEDFTAYCALRDAQVNADGAYKQYVYGQFALAQYRQGNAATAVNTAVSALGENAFPKNNAFVALALQVLMANDANTKMMIQSKMEELDNGLSAADKAYLDELVALLG